MRAILLAIVLCTSQAAFSQQWTTATNGTDIYNNNTGNVGIGVQPAGYKLDVNGYIHTRLAFIADAPSAGSINGWFRGPVSGGSANLIMQADGGSAAAFWISGSSVLKIGGSGATEPSMGAINVTSDGRVGIGVMDPGAPKLEVRAAPITSVGTREMATMDANTGNTSQLKFLINKFGSGGDWTSSSTRIQAWTDATPQAYIDFNPNGGTYGMTLGTGSGEVFRITSNNTVLIGKTSQINSGYILDVNGNARANQVVVNTSGADFVFDPGYHLPGLKELDAYVRREHHLPDIAPAAQMQKEGVDLGANQTRLLQKIEELTLYTIQQDKAMDELKDKVRRLEEQNSRMESLLKRIEQLEHAQNPTSNK